MPIMIVAMVLILSNFMGCSESSPNINLDESIRVTDSLQISGPALINVIEDIGVTDSSLTPEPPSARLIETITVTDSALILSSITISLMEIIRVSDSPSLQPVPGQLPPPAQVTVTVFSPKAGAVWRVGTSQDIVWTTTGEGISYVGIYYSIDAGKSMYVIAKKESNDGAHTWKVPNTPSKTALVRVLAYNASGQTLALGDSQLFTISVQ